MKISFIFLLIIILLLAGCGKKSTPPQQNANNRQSGIFSITVSKNDKSEYLKITRNGDAFDIMGNGKLIGTIDDKGDKLKIYNADKTEAGKVQLDGTDIKLKDAKDNRIAKIKTENGDISVKDSANNKFMKIKPDGNNYKIDDATGKKIGKIKNNGDKWSISDNNGLIYTFTGNTSAGITGILITNKLTLLQQSALIAGYNLLLNNGN